MAYKKPIPRTDREKAAFAHWLAHPVDAVKDWFHTTPDDWQGDLLTALFTGDVDRVAGKAAHGPGKTAVDAWAGWIFLNCFMDCRVVATAPTFAQLHDVLFPEFSKWHNKFPDRIKQEWVISGGHVRHKLNPLDWFAVARTSNQPSNLQGFHGTDILILADEASAIPANVFEVMEGALSEAGELGKTAKLLMAGNPNFNSGELHDAFTRNQELYHRITITGDPDFLASLGIEHGDNHADHGHTYYSPRVKKKYVETIAKKYGRDSAVFDVRVRGIFPRAADDTIISLDNAERAAALVPPSFDPVADPFSVIIDPSRGGAAETVIGMARQGIVLEFASYKGKLTTHQVAAHAHDMVMKHKLKGLRLAEIVCDLPGIGGGVIDVLRKDYSYPVREYDGGKPLVKGVDPDDEVKMFQNKRARDWWRLRRRLEVGNYPIPNDDVCVAQLASVKYRYMKGTEKIVAESKQDMKDRLGPEASPDRGDVVVMAQAPDFTVANAGIGSEDVFVGEDRPTSEYQEDMEAGLC